MPRFVSPLQQILATPPQEPVRSMVELKPRPIETGPGTEQKLINQPKSSEIVLKAESKALRRAAL